MLFFRCWQGFACQGVSGVERFRRILWLLWWRSHAVLRDLASSSLASVSPWRCRSHVSRADGVCVELSHQHLQNIICLRRTNTRIQLTAQRANVGQLWVMCWLKSHVSSMHTWIHPHPKSRNYGNKQDPCPVCELTSPHSGSLKFFGDCGNYCRKILQI